MTDDAFSRLLKVISLERRQGYRNKAVIGGLDKFASRWEADALAQASDRAAVAEIVALLIGYPAVEDTAARERIIDQIVRRAKDAAPETPAAPTGEPRPEARAPSGMERPSDQVLTEPAPAQPAPPATPAPRSAPLPKGPASTKPGPAAEATPRAEPLVAGAPGPAQAAVSGREAEPDGQPEAPAVEEARELPAPPAEPTPPGRPASRPTTAPAEAELPRQAPKPRPERPGSGLDAPVTRLPGIGPGLAEKLAKLGVHTVRDLLYLLPHRYEDYSHLRTIDRLRYGEEATVIGTVWDLKSRIIGTERKIITAIVEDGTGQMEMTWFNPWVERRLARGRAYSFSGRIESYRGRLLIRNPEFEPLDRDQVHTGRLVPIYPLTAGITAHWLRSIMSKAVESFSAAVPDFLPEAIRREYGLLTLADALRQIHFPDSQEQIRAAHRRLSFDEFLLLQLGVLGARQRFRGQPARPLNADEAVLAPFIARLPYDLTAAQRRALADIAADLAGTQPMSRLLQGDVGSGKTAVAAAALWVAVANGTQGAIMAPTEILAEQHVRSFEAMFAGLMHPSAQRPVRIELFTGHLRRADRAAALAALAAGEIDIAVGTHALIQEGVTFRELTVAVVDEQHRFGVEQRAALRQRGAAAIAQPYQPHMLVMSATPIPRSLALTIYGDLDVSVIDEMPVGRTPIKTKWLTSTQRERAYAFIRRQVAEGRQAFIIYPLVETSQASDARAAVDEHARLQSEVFPDLRVGLLHGRLRGEEKDSVMRAFAAGELDILVATSVVEVGIDVPNATVIMIEGAERFGLAQLHQFRGRVGRGPHPSYCLLISDAAAGESAQRLSALETNNDGFALAQIDLDLRGPGDFFGTRQSGLPPLRTAQLGDLRTLEMARAAAQKLFAEDPLLESPEHQPLAGQVAALWSGAGDVS